MDDIRVDIAWSDPARPGETPRNVFVHDELRYAQRANQRDVELDGFINYHWLTSPDANGRPKVMLEAGINAPSEVSAQDGERRPLTEPRGVVGFEVILGAYSPLSITAMGPVSLSG